MMKRTSWSKNETHMTHRPTWSKHEADLEHTSCTCIFNAFVSCLLYRVNGVLIIIRGCLISRLARLVHRFVLVASWIKKMSRAGSCDFPTNTVDFRQGAKNFNSASKFSKNGNFFNPKFCIFGPKFFDMCCRSNINWMKLNYDTIERWLTANVRTWFRWPRLTFDLCRRSARPCTVQLARNWQSSTPITSCVKRCSQWCSSGFRRRTPVGCSLLESLFFRTRFQGIQSQLVVAWKYNSPPYTLLYWVLYIH